MASERARGLADGNQSGKNQVVANPSFYGLYTEAEINATIASERARGTDGNNSGQSYLQNNRLQFTLQYHRSECIGYNFIPPHTSEGNKRNKLCKSISQLI